MVASPAPRPTVPPQRVLDYLIGFDVAQSVDYSALAVVELPVWVGSEEDAMRYRTGGTGWISPDRIDPRHVELLRRADPHPWYEQPLNLRWLPRWQGMKYGEQVEIIAKVMTAPHFAGRSALVMDRTGVGTPVYDLLAQVGIKPVGVTITGGHEIHRTAGETYSVPKKELIDSLRVALENRLLRVAKQMENADTLMAELSNYRVKVSLSTGHPTFEPGEWRDGTNDDLVLACSLATWYHQYLRRRRGGESVAFCGHGIQITGAAARYCPECDLGRRLTGGPDQERRETNDQTGAQERGSGLSVRHTLR